MLYQKNQWHTQYADLEIARVLEYSTIHHFSRQFKQTLGITPSEYARTVQ